MKLIMFAVLSCVVFAAHSVDEQDSDAVPVTQADSDFLWLVETASEWRRAVVDGDIGRVASFTWPEMEQGAKRAIGDTASAAHRRLLGGPHSIASRLRGSRNAQVRIFERTYGGSGLPAQRYLALCYKFNDLSGEQWPTSFARLLAVDDSEAFCMYWMKSGKSLKTSYDFLLD